MRQNASVIIFILFSWSLSATASPTIVNGSVARLKEHPWQVALIMNGKFSCGGSLISKRFIITAAHCIKPSIQVYGTGDGNIKNVKKLGSISKVHVHPSYKLEPRAMNDIALIELSEPVTNSDTLKPIPLAKTSSAFSGIEATGWGWIRDWEKIPENQIPAISDLRLAKSFKELPAWNNPFWKKDTNFNKYIFGYSKAFLGPDAIMFDQLNSGVCHGDSGGPVTAKIAGVTTLVGLVSSSFYCGRGILFATSMAYFYPWIKKIVKL